MTAPRYAIYYAPPATHPLGVAGAAWLGRDAGDATDRRPPVSADVADPWRYGFHATLKSPMRLAPRADPAAVAAAVAQLAARHTAFPMPRLRVALLDRLLALRPAEPLPATHPLCALAADAVCALDPWRAPLSDAERVRHGRAGLSPRQQHHLQRWGYPHVLEDWRFHLTLTGALPDDEGVRDARRAAAQRHFTAALAAPLVCDDLALFVQPSPGEPFQLHQRHTLRSACPDLTDPARSEP